MTALSDALRLGSGPVSLADHDPAATPLFAGRKTDGKAALGELGETVSALQERLFADSRVAGKRSVLLVLQGMDTSGKGGVLRHSVGLLDPQGVQIASFKAPTDEERAHDFLWRIERRLPGHGMIGIFDRSHYEDVLIARVRKLAPADEIERRYGAINDWEAAVTGTGTTIIKCFLHISKATQKERLFERLDDPTKHWKYNPGDVDERLLWDDYQRAYEVALERCNTSAAPFYVIPSNRKWYRNWAITRLLVDHLEELDPQWPVGDFDVEIEKRRLAAS